MEKKVVRPLVDFSRYHLNPTILFVLSFLGLIILGTGLLLLPQSSAGGRVMPLDAFFMATSAVCVTGLLVFDYTKELSSFGINVILLLIQLGGDRDHDLYHVLLLSDLRPNIL